MMSRGWNSAASPETTSKAGGGMGLSASCRTPTESLSAAQLRSSCGDDASACFWTSCGISLALASNDCRIGTA
eukprot:9191055-Pyramimonas_sp.AAC.1